LLAFVSEPLCEVREVTAEQTLSQYKLPHSYKAIV